MAESTSAVTAGVTPPRGGMDWHGMTAEDACAQLGVDPGNGLDADEVGRRRAQVGPNRLAEAESEPGWRRSCASTGI